jgi:hypothetical protein
MGRRQCFTAPYYAARSPSFGVRDLDDRPERDAVARRLGTIRWRPTGRPETLTGEPDVVVLARPEGFGRALATYEIPIEGRDEWLAAARRLA